MPVAVVAISTSAEPAFGVVVFCEGVTLKPPGGSMTVSVALDVPIAPALSETLTVKPPASASCTPAIDSVLVVPMLVMVTAAPLALVPPLLSGVLP